MEHLNDHEQAAPIDSEGWTCAGCGEQMIGDRTPDELCGPCIAARLAEPAQRPGRKRQTVLPDTGGWISGPMIPVDEAVLATALDVGCPIHQVEAGEECPLVGACLARQSIALS